MKAFVIASLVMPLIALPAAAQDGNAFLARLAGSWSGSGTVTTAAGATPGATTCRLTGSPSGGSVTVSGSCDGAARGATLAMVLRWSEPTQQFMGSFQGGSEAGSLTGRLSGDTLLLTISSPGGGTNSMLLTLNGSSATLKVNAKDTAGKSFNFVQLGLRKA